jgi:hypothetical protein
LFCLDESGDVIWTVPEETEAIPLFNCETYEISDTALSRVVVRFGAYAGHVIEFMVRCEKVLLASKFMFLLIHRKWHP